MKHLLYICISLLLLSCNSQQITQQDQEKTVFKLENADQVLLLDSHRGYQLFKDEGCQQCHGKKLEGTLTGPPLVYNLYKKGSHHKRRLNKSIKYGTKQNHWEFGEMPAYPDLSDEQIDLLIDYIRDSIKLNKVI